MGDRNRLFISYSHEDTKWLGAVVEPCPWEHVAWLARLQLRPQDSKRRAEALSTFQGAARKQKLADVAGEIATLVTQ